MQKINANLTDYVMVPDASLDVAGAQTFWRLHGELPDYALLVQALESRNIDHAPVPCEPETALRRAVQDLKGKRRLVRPLRKGAWAVVEEELDDANDRLKHWDGPTITLDKLGRPAFKNATAEEAQAVGTAYAYYLTAMTTEDISSWLCKQADRLSAVSMRPGGGIYYIPPSRMPEWRAIQSALLEAAPGHVIYTIPTIRMTTDGAKAILDCLSDEIEMNMTKISKKVISGELGVRGLNTRADETRELLSKVVQYEGIMGERLDTLRNHLAKLEADVVAATLAAEAAEAEQV